MNQPLNLGGADLPRDFSVYYVAAWRMFHNPSQIFNTQPLNNGEPAIYPPITPYKYLPSFLVLISPLLNLSYYQAFWVFDVIQFILLPIMAFLLYKLLENKHPLVALAVLVAVLLLPYPMAGRGLSVSYFMSWAEGQAKIFLSFLLLLSFYLGYKGKAGLSGVAFALGAFDPRFAVLAFPLFLFYNKGKLKTCSCSHGNCACRIQRCRVLSWNSRRFCRHGFRFRNHHTSLYASLDTSHHVSFIDCYKRQAVGRGVKKLVLASATSNKNPQRKQ